MARKKKEETVSIAKDLTAAFQGHKISVPEVGDIVQTITREHPFLARIGIVHHEDGESLICYHPGKGGHPHKFAVKKKDVAVVGKARLRYGKPLPEDSVYADNSLDKI